MTTTAEHDNKYETAIPEVNVVLEDIKQFVEHCREIPFDKVTKMRHGKMVKPISFVIKKVEEFVKERETLKIRLHQLGNFNTRQEKLEEAFIKGEGASQYKFDSREARKNGRSSHQNEEATSRDKHLGRKHGRNRGSSQ